MLRRIFLVLLLSFFLCANVHAACVWTESDTVGTAASCSIADIEDCLDDAECTAEDTINVPAGNCTWASRLTITEGINLIGAGSANTVITASVVGDGSSTGDAHRLVVYDPSVPASNHAFRLSGFTFDCDGKIQALKLTNATTSALTKVRIDNNKFLNGVTGTRFCMVYGTVYGVIDNNYFDKNTAGGQIFDFYALNSTTWDNLSFSYGTADNMHFEDNTLVNIQDAVHDLGLGGRACIRYNDYTHDDGAGIYSWLIIHDDQPGANYSAMGIEAYGNLLSSDTTSSFCTQRGAALAMFYNKIVRVGHSGSYSILIRERYPDNCPDNCSSPYNSGVNFVTATDGQPQHVSETYIWNNRYDGILIDPSLSVDCCSGLGGYGPWDDCCYNNSGADGILENTDWWEDAAAFDGTVGIGCGALGSRPATCTTGVGYWATDQSCSDLTNCTGINPSTPISGTFYRCTSTDTWTSYFTPYTYPHPLRNFPTITDVNSDTSSGTYTTGKVIDIDVTFSEICTSTGVVTITTDIGRACTFTLTSESFGTCDITVQDGDNSNDLNVTDISGIIKDADDNTLINFTPAVNLADHKDIIIQTDVAQNPPYSHAGGVHTGGVHN